MHKIQIKFDNNGQLDSYFVCKVGVCTKCMGITELFDECTFEMVITTKECLFIEIPVEIDNSNREEPWLRIKNPEQYSAKSND